MLRSSRGILDTLGRARRHDRKNESVEIVDIEYADDVLNAKFSHQNTNTTDAKHIGEGPPVVIPRFGYVSIPSLWIFGTYTVEKYSVDYTECSE